jgi:hypothetical protein
MAGRPGYRSGTVPRRRTLDAAQAREGAAEDFAVNQIYDWKYLLDTDGKNLLLKLVRAYEDVIGVEVLT